MKLENWYIEKQWPHVPAKEWHTSPQWLAASGNPQPPWYYIHYDFDMLSTGCYKGVTGPLTNVPNPGDAFLEGYGHVLGCYDNRHDAATKITSILRMAKCRRYFEMYKNLMCYTRVPREVILDEILTYIIN